MERNAAEIALYTIARHLKLQPLFTLIVQGAALFMENGRSSFLNLTWDRLIQTETSFSLIRSTNKLQIHLLRRYPCWL